MDVSEIPQNIKDMAAAMNVDLEQLVAQMGEQAHPQAQQQPQPQVAPNAAAAAAIGTGIPGTVQTPGGAQVAPEVTARDAETPEETLRRELAVSQQELQQTRANMQSLQDARVVGNSGLSGPVQDTPPNLGGIEPGIRFAIRNGLIEAEALEHKLGPIIVDLFKRDLGGII